MNQKFFGQLKMKLKIWRCLFFNNENALYDFQNLLAPTMTSFHDRDCPSNKCTKNLFGIIREAIDKSAVIET